MPCLRLRKAAFPARKATWQASRGGKQLSTFLQIRMFQAPFPWGPRHSRTQHRGIQKVCPGARAPGSTAPREATHAGSGNDTPRLSPSQCAHMLRVKWHSEQGKGKGQGPRQRGDFQCGDKEPLVLGPARKCSFTFHILCLKRYGGTLYILRRLPLKMAFKEF